jgi:hypothetical protein
MNVAIARYFVVRGATALLEHRLDVSSVAGPRFGEIRLRDFAHGDFTYVSRCNMNALVEFGRLNTA